MSNKFSILFKYLQSEMNDVSFISQGRNIPISQLSILDFPKHISSNSYALLHKCVAYKGWNAKEYAGCAFKHLVVPIKFNERICIIVKHISRSFHFLRSSFFAHPDIPEQIMQTLNWFGALFVLVRITRSRSRLKCQPQ